jgi:SAM-dependent methyltransferase
VTAGKIFRKSPRSIRTLALLAALLALPVNLGAQEPNSPGAGTPKNPGATEHESPGTPGLKELDTPYVPTPQAVVERMLDLAKVKAGEMVVDLGSGDGRIMITAAKEYGARGFGVEIDPYLVQTSNEQAVRAGVADRVKFLKQDLFKTDFHEADVLTLYLLPDVNAALRPKILSEMKPGTRVVSHDYGMGTWLPDAQETISAPDKTVGAVKESTVYLWIVPARVQGSWDLEISLGKKARHYPLTLDQQFQLISGSVVGATKQDGEVRGKLDGPQITLELPPRMISRDRVELVGRVTGDTARGSVRRGDRAIATWSARRRS